MRVNRGFTLLEIVIGLVVTSIVMLIVTDLLGTQARQSVAPVTQARANALAHGLQREILSKAFDENSTGHNAGERCSETISCTSSANLGPDSGESRATFDDVDDYHGYAVIRNSAGQIITQDGLDLFQGYQINVAVFYDDNLDGIDDDTGLGSYSGDTKLIRVSVLTPNNDTIVYSGYRWNY